jgi:hypothetical protein
MHGIDVIEELEAQRGWTFRCCIADTMHVTLSLDWTDYNRWCPGGGRSPSDVAQAVLLCLLTDGVVLPDQIDAGRIRRLGPDADDRVRKALSNQA